MNREPSATPAASFWHTLVLVSGVLLGVLLVCRLVVLLGYPLGVDQGVFAWIGQVVASGGRPYLDAWDVKGPGVFAFSALLSLAMPGALGMRIFDLLLQLLAVAVLVRHPVGTNDRRAGWLAATVYLAGYASLGFHETAQPDSWANALLVIGLVPAIRAVEELDSASIPRTLLVASAMVTLAALFKPTYGAVGLVPVTLLLLWLRKRPDAPRVRTASFVALGFALPALACVLWLTGLGALTEMWNVVVRWNSSVYAGGTNETPRHLAYAVVFGFFRNVRWWPLGLAMSVPLLLAVRRNAARITLLWLFAIMIEIAFQRKFWGYHWTALLGPLSVAASFVYADASSRRPTWYARAGLRSSALVGLVLCVLVGMLASIVWRERVRLTDVHSVEALDLLGSYQPSLQGFDSVLVVVRRTTTPSDRVLFFGTLAIGYFESARASVSRISMSRPLLDGQGTAERERYRQEFWDDWRATPPAVVVTYSPAHCAAHLEVQWTCPAAFPALSEELAIHYHPADEVGGFLVFRRK